MTEREPAHCTTGCPYGGRWGATGVLPPGHFIHQIGWHTYLAHTLEFEQEINTMTTTDTRAKVEAEIAEMHRPPAPGTTASPTKQIVLGDPTKPAQPVLTGDLRSTLQPVAFIRLTAPVPSIYGGLMFKAGDLVSAQYWGGGHITLTRVPDGARAIVVAHDIKATQP